MAGADWSQAFLRRHPHLSLRRLEPTISLENFRFKLGKCKGFFYKTLCELWTRYNLPANHVFNIDEANTTTMQSPSKIISPKVPTQLYKAVS